MYTECWFQNIADDKPLFITITIKIKTVYLISRFHGGDKSDSSFERFLFASEAVHKYTTKKLNYNT
ncbi:Uncharacterised protein [Vibrio cholerae]|nr:Uncharacterised protein [Vibrio cholerae]CSC21208.1 Uncharacterised protein [Vibrio cholerae]CSI88361.1 Uncharacterised protein [Vibrio cholerae]